MNDSIMIPVIDLTRETDRQTVVDREPGVYLGHTTTALLSDGRTIVAVYPKNHGNGQIVLKKSFDGGLSWSGRLPVPESWSTSLEVPTLFRIDACGEKDRLIMFSGMYPIRMSVSHDCGESWSELEPIGNYGGIVAMADIEQNGINEYFALFHDDGRFIHGGNDKKIEVYRAGRGNDIRTKVLHFSSPDGGKTWSEPSENWVRSLERDNDAWEKIYTETNADRYADGHFELYRTRSFDGGLTWGEAERINVDAGDAKLCEPCIIRSPDGGTIAVLLRDESRKHHSFLITSTDNANSWSEPVELPAALTGDRHTAIYLSDGRLFITFRDMLNGSPTKGSWVGWIGKFEDIVNLNEGQYRVIIMKNYHAWDCAYPGLVLLPDGTVVTTSYGHFTPDEPAYIVSVRFKPEELDARLFGDRENKL